MEVQIDTLINIASLLLGGGGGAFFVWRYQRMKAKAEAQQAEASAAKELQDMYQQMIADAKSDREDRRQQNEELRQERDHYKNDRNELRERMEKITRSFMEWRIQADNDRSEMKMSITELSRKVEMMRPFLCADLSCKLRQRVVISEEGEINHPSHLKRLKEATGEESEQQEIEPLESNEL